MEHGGSDRRRGGPDRRGRREKTKILIVDDHPLFRLGIHYILEKEGDLEVVGEADGGRSAFEAVVETSPDIRAARTRWLPAVLRMSGGPTP
jgi:DNA-binding NarL/FixJ family response regulator